MFEESTTNSTKGKHFFIAYRVTADAIAQQIVAYLHENDVNVWYFPYKVTWGSSVTTEEEKAIDASYGALIILTPDFFEGKTTIEEYRALEAKKRQDQNYKIGVMRVDCPREKVPPFLRDYFDVEIKSLKDPKLDDAFNKILRGIRGQSLEPSPSEHLTTDATIVSLIEENRLDEAISLLRVSKDDLGISDRKAIVELCCDLLLKRNEEDVRTKLTFISTSDVYSAQFFVEKMISEREGAEEMISEIEIIKLFRLILSQNVKHAKNLAIAALDEKNRSLANFFVEEIAGIDPKIGIIIIYNYLKKYIYEIRGYENDALEAVRSGHVLHYAKNQTFSTLFESLNNFYPQKLDEFTCGLTGVFPRMEQLLEQINSPELKDINRLLIQSLPTFDAGLRRFSLGVLARQGFHEIVPYAGELLLDDGCSRNLLHGIPRLLENIGCACCVPYLKCPPFIDDYKPINDQMTWVLNRITDRLFDSVECKPDAHNTQEPPCKNLIVALEHEDGFVRLGALLIVARCLDESYPWRTESKSKTDTLEKLLRKRKEEETEESLVNLINEILNKDYPTQYPIDAQIELGPTHFPTYWRYQTVFLRDD